MKLFENVSGNQFRLLNESVLSESSNVREGLKKVFSSAGNEIPYSRLQNVGLGYIKDITEARKCALQEAKELALEFGYANNEAEQKFVKEFQRADGTDTSEPPRISAPSASSKESREVQIGKTLMGLVQPYLDDPDMSDPRDILDDIKKLGHELVFMHQGQ